jgi:hypothetical protein
MSTLTDSITKAKYQNGYILLTSESGLEIKFPIAGNPRLSGSSESELSNIEVSPFGIHWPALDEDLSFKGILEGRFGQEKK